MHDALGGGTVIACAAELFAPISDEAVSGAAATLCRTHPVLTFSPSGGRFVPHWRAIAVEKVAIPEPSEFLDALTNRSFPAGAPPVAIATCGRMVGVAFHHAIVDGLSAFRFLRDLVELAYAPRELQSPGALGPSVEARIGARHGATSLWTNLRENVAHEWRSRAATPHKARFEQHVPFARRTTRHLAFALPQHESEAVIAHGKSSGAGLHAWLAAAELLANRDQFFARRADTFLRHHTAIDLREAAGMSPRELACAIAVVDTAHAVAGKTMRALAAEIAGALPIARARRGRMATKFPRWLAHAGVRLTLRSSEADRRFLYQSSLTNLGRLADHPADAHIARYFANSGRIVGDFPFLAQVFSHRGIVQGAFSYCEPLMSHTAATEHFERFRAHALQSAALRRAA
ncbi:MAG: hypothetical protein IT381_24400 [Deltaproteobacteria bacterium]|nr:hypothetical protein [Deltaproteobacteria bacterium]